MKSWLDWAERLPSSGAALAGDPALARAGAAEQRTRTALRPVFGAVQRHDANARTDMLISFPCEWVPTPGPRGTALRGGKRAGSHENSIFGLNKTAAPSALHLCYIGSRACKVNGGDTTAANDSGRRDRVATGQAQRVHPTGADASRSAVQIKTRGLLCSLLTRP